MLLVLSLEKSCKKFWILVYRQCGRRGHSCEGGIQPGGHRRQYTAQVYYEKNIFFFHHFKELFEFGKTVPYFFNGSVQLRLIVVGHLQFFVICDVKSVEKIL
jgi:hypothetical protein